VSDTLNVDDMDATDSAESSVTGASGTTEDSRVRENVTYSYDGDDDDDDDEDICRELAQLNWDRYPSKANHFYFIRVTRCEITLNLSGESSTFDYIRDRDRSVV